MKNLIYTIIVSFFLSIGSMTLEASTPVTIQDTVQADMGALMAEDSVSVDNMDPTFYSPIEDEDANTEGSKNSSLYIYIFLGIVVLGGGLFFYSRSKKK